MGFVNKADTQVVDEVPPIEDGMGVRIGDPDIWGNGNNGYTQPAIGVQSRNQQLVLNAAHRLQSMSIVNRSNISTSHGKRVCARLEGSVAQDGVLLTEEPVRIYEITRTESDYIALFDGDQCIGWLQASTSARPTKCYVVEGVFVRPEYREQKLGLLLYQTAVSRFLALRSSSDIGIMAVRAWRSLSKTHNVTLYHWVSGKPSPMEEVEFEWGTDSIPVVEGAPITSTKDDFFFLARK
jgi:GNAT superfamily N-acetyltransferase